MTFYQMICVSKLMAVAAGVAGSATISNEELDVACEGMKMIADNRNDWTWEQRELYKTMIEYIKEHTKHNYNF